MRGHLLQSSHLCVAMETDGGESDAALQPLSDGQQELVLQSRSDQLQPEGEASS